MLKLKEALDEVAKWDRVVKFAHDHKLDFHAANELAEIGGVNMAFVLTLAANATGDATAVNHPSTSVLGVPVSIPLNEMRRAVRKQCLTAKSHWAAVGRTWEADAPERYMDEI